MASACQQRRICYGLLLKPGQCTTRQQETSGDVEGHASVRPANGSHLGLKHDFGELSIVDLAITVQVSLSNHAVDGLLIHRVTHGGEHVDELLAVNEAGAISVEGQEGILDLLLHLFLGLVGAPSGRRTRRTRWCRTCPCPPPRREQR